MGHAGDDRHAAALDRELDDPDALAGLDMHELAGGTEHDGALDAAPGEIIDQFQHAAEIGFMALQPVRSYRGRQYTL